VRREGREVRIIIEEIDSEARLKGSEKDVIEAIMI